MIMSQIRLIFAYAYTQENIAHCRIFILDIFIAHIIKEKKTLVCLEYILLALNKPVR